MHLAFFITRLVAVTNEILTLTIVLPVLFLIPLPLLWMS